MCSHSARLPQIFSCRVPVRAGNLASRLLFSILLSIPPIPKPPAGLCEELSMAFWWESYFDCTLWPQCWAVLGGEMQCENQQTSAEVCLQRLCSLREGAESRLTLNCRYSIPCFDFLLLYEQILIRDPWQIMAVTAIAQVPHWKRLTLFINSQQCMLAATGSCSLPSFSGLSPYTGQLQFEGAQSMWLILAFQRGDKATAEGQLSLVKQTPPLLPLLPLLWNLQTVVGWHRSLEMTSQPCNPLQMQQR